MGLGMTSVLVVLGSMRELIGNGTLFDGADLLLGDWAAALRIQVFQFDSSFLLALLPPGAFIGVGLFDCVEKCYRQLNSGSSAERRKTGH